MSKDIKGGDGGGTGEGGVWGAGCESTWLFEWNGRLDRLGLFEFTPVPPSSQTRHTFTAQSPFSRVYRFPDVSQLCAPGSFCFVCLLLLLLLLLPVLLQLLIVSRRTVNKQNNTGDQQQTVRGSKSMNSIEYLPFSLVSLFGCECVVVVLVPFVPAIRLRMQSNLPHQANCNLATAIHQAQHTNGAGSNTATHIPCRHGGDHQYGQSSTR